MLTGLCPRCVMALNLGTQTDVPGGGPGQGGAETTKPSSPPAPAPEEIARLFPHLEVLGMLGRGGMGAVYKARQPKLDRFVALKILLRRPEGVAADTAFGERFAREARALARLNHPAIVAVYDYGEAGGYPYLVMEYVDGLTLRQLMQTGKLAPEEALVIVPKICEALEFAHQQGVVHRDIKPENILLDKQGRVKIADFGIAKILEPGSQPHESSLTGGKDVVGTPHYMAPEQVEQPAKVDHRADIFSLGVVFYEMLTGELPLGKFPPPSRKVQVDVRLDEVVLRALEKAPERRYQHASEVKSDVETIAATKAARPSEAAPEPTKVIEVTKRTKGEFLGVGAVVQALGLGCFFIPYVGPLVGVILLLIGGRMALKLICTRCGNRTTREASLCATCGAHFVAPASEREGLAHWTRVLRWVARVIGTTWAVGFVVFLLAQGGLLPQESKTLQLAFAAVALMLAGSLAGWWREGWAALFSLCGWAAFQIADAQVRLLSFFNWPALVGVLFAVVWAQRLVPPRRRAVAALAVGFPFLLGLALNLGGPLFADKPMKLSGRVTDALTGQPIARARVDDNRYGAGTGQAPRNCWTDTNGHYTLNTFYEEHTVAASAPGYETRFATLLTKPFGYEGEVKMDFALRPAPEAEARPRRNE